MRWILLGLLLVACSGCKHTNKRVEPVYVPIVKEEKVDEKERTRSISIQIMPINNLTIKAI
jgi:hypothetical protein